MQNLLKGLVCLLFVLLVMAQAGKKFVLDEIDFPIAAKATSETWRPVYYRGEENPNHFGNYHPTLYIHALALFIKIFGYNENVIRAFGLICTLLTTWFAIAIYHHLIPDDSKHRMFETVYVSLFLLHPYTIANTTLPDIDSTVLPVVIAAFIYVLIRGCVRSDVSESKVRELQIRRNAAGLTALLTLCLWAKLTTPLILIPFAFAIMALYGVPIRKALAYALIVGGIGLLLFLFTYWAYCTLLSLPFEYTFRFLVASFSKGTASTKSIFTTIGLNLLYTRYFLSWLTLPTLTLFGASILFLWWAPAIPERKVLLAFAGLGLFVTVFYLGLTSPFSGFFKYPYATFFLLMLPIAAVVTEIMDRSSPREALLSTLLTVSVAVAYARLYWDNYIGQSVSLIPVLVSLCVAGFVGFVLTHWPNSAISRWLTLGLLVYTIGVGLAISRSQAIAPYPTKYYYRQTGLEETITYLKGRVIPGEVIWSMKDVGYYVNNQYIENYGFFFDPALQSRLIDMLRIGAVRYYVATVGIGEDRVDSSPVVRSILESYCVKERVFGNYIIYRVRER